MVSMTVEPTPVCVGPPPVDPEIAVTVCRNGGALVGPDEARVMVWQRHNGVGFAEWLAAAPQAEWVQLPSAGIDWLFDQDLYRPGIIWTCAKGAFGDAVAELALGLLIAGFRSIADYSRADSWLSERGRMLSGSQVAIVGAGGIATALLDRLRPLGAETWVVLRHLVPVPLADHVVTRDELVMVLRVVDAVVLAVPLTGATRGMIGASELGAMKAGAWLVNVGRGELVVTSALIEALARGSIGGAALDVTDPEPLPNGHPLWSLPNVILTPHVGATAALSAGPFASLFRENLLRWQAGEQLLGLVDPDAGY